jgi:hypothetical protein
MARTLLTDGVTDRLYDLLDAGIRQGAERAHQAGLAEAAG